MPLKKEKVLFTDLLLFFLNQFQREDCKLSSYSRKIFEFSRDRFLFNIVNGPSSHTSYNFLYLVTGSTFLDNFLTLKIQFYN